MTSPFHSPYQHTLRHAFTCEGIGLHSGELVRMTLTPAETDTGIVFKRTDVSAPISYVHARYDHVTDTMLGTTVTNEHGVAVSTIEHLMAALWGSGLDNAYIELSSPELPIMDGSAEPFLALIDDVGLERQAQLRSQIRVLKRVSVKEGKSTATLSPGEGFELQIEIDFPHQSIARQAAHFDFQEVTFGEALSQARTFGFAHEVEKMRSMGLARGGSLANAIVVGEEGVLNEGGLRFTDEFVRHKALDCVGDYFLAGGRLIGHVKTERPGHGINNKLLRALFADRANWRYETSSAHRPATFIPPVELPAMAL